MKRLLKIIAAGLAIWLLSLIWLDLNLILMWPLVVGIVVGMMPAYLFGRLLNQLYHSQAVQPVYQPLPPTRPLPISRTIDLAVDPTRPSRVVTRQERAANPTHPMPVL